MRKKDVIWRYSDYTPTDKDESCWNCKYLEENDGPLFGCSDTGKKYIHQVPDWALYKNRKCFVGGTVK